MSITSTTDKNDWEILANWAAYCGSDVIELNLSCPNKWLDGQPVGMVADDPEAIVHIVALVRSVVGVDMRLSVKLPPYSSTIPPRILSALQAININMFVSCNTAGGHPTTIDGEQVLSMPQAGLSGPALCTHSVQQVSYLHKVIPNIPVIGVGGISSGADAKRFLDADAIGFCIGTHFFLNGPKVFGEVVQELVDLTED
ncbi:MAG: hypothetical protein JKX80_02375 [Candidatus Pacebacteria bacterium]|nr:hypothetical protein [Candidatus Paceibacterota bacterium]